MATPLRRRVQHEFDLNLGYIDDCLGGRDFLLGDDLTAADVQMSFVGELAVTSVDVRSFANLDAWVARFQGRPAYRAALARGGAYRFARQ